VTFATADVGGRVGVGSWPGEEIDFLGKRRMIGRDIKVGVAHHSLQQDSVLLFLLLVSGL
jgi:hypothetical protein